MFGKDFGNPLLRERFEEITLPEQVGFWPQTLGWAILAGFLLAALLWFGVCRYRLWKANRYRTDALKKLARLGQALRSSNRKSHLLMQLPALLKETALRAFGREKVASLAGGQWLDFLDQTCGGVDFSDGCGRLLLTLSYRTPAQLQQIPDSDIREVMALIQSWIRRHHVCV